ncbi:MAG: hypothetical protein HYV16_08675 [Gammaproteobacteria bacterium]|nr:hypothetical protein [Gammaproteobacteria bacterium]
MPVTITKRAALSLLLCLALPSPGAVAAEPTKPLPQARRNLVLEQAFGLKLDAMAQEEVAKNEARYLRNLYKALIEEGFTEEEAFEIVVHHRSLLSES